MSDEIPSLAAVIMQSGILDENTLNEFRHWKLLTGDTPVGPRPTTASELVKALDDALQDAGLVLERVTDLDLIQQFLATQQVGTLHVVIGDEEADMEVIFGRTKLGEYIFPWKGESLSEDMCNGLTYLDLPEEKVFFWDFRELFYGPIKAFLICKPAPNVEPHGNLS